MQDGRNHSGAPFLLFCVCHVCLTGMSRNCFGTANCEPCKRSLIAMRLLIEGRGETCGAL